MTRFELQPVVCPTLPEVAAFMHRWRSEAANPPAHSPARETAFSIERRLKWLLIDNPYATTDATLGYCLRDSRGVIRGINLFFPIPFVCADKRLPGLCSGSFFVEPAARSMGFYLFKKYLRTPGYAFYFSTTCNATSSVLWRSMGGYPVPHSETEYVLPFRLDVVIPAFVARSTSSQVAAGMARICGRGANPILRFLTRRSPKLAVEPCQDWEKLSELSHRHRHAEYITSDRSAALLAWRYGPGSPAHPGGVYLVRDGLGNEAWFSLGDLTHGEGGRLRQSVLLDAIWPREKMNFRHIFHEIVRLAAGRSDAIFLRWQPGLDFRQYSPFAIPHKLGAPRAFVCVPKGMPDLPLGPLDYDDSDYIAWRFQWANDEAAGGQEVPARLD